MESAIDVQIGDSVVFHDESGSSMNALVCCIHTLAPYYCVNLVLLSDNPAEQDQYGRQIRRRSSVYHRSAVHAHGMYWRLAGEEPIPYTPPVAV